MDDASALKRALYRTFMRVAQRVGERIMEGKSVGLVERLLYWIGDLVVYGPLRNVLGMSRIRIAYTGGEAIGPDLFVFYRSIGVNLKQLYGSTETSVFVCIQPNDRVKSDTVGPAIPGVELKFTPGRELLIRSPGLFKEYYKNPQATAEAKDAEGWFHTGDAGFVDPDGHLKIIDRAKDVGALTDGTLFAPKYLENKLKFFPHIREAVCFGHGRDQVCAFINIDPDSVGNWAEKRSMAYSGYTDLASGGVKALTEVSFDVREHEVRAIIGPNGAGKSSMLNVLNGVYHPQKGKIRFRGNEFTDMDSHEAASLGIARTFQNIALFKGMTVLDNIMTGRNLKMHCGVLQQALWLGPARREELEHRRAAEEIIDFLEIQHVRKTPVGRLPYGLQKRVELGRALAAEPLLLLLDEPMAGMNLEEKQDMCRFVLDVNDHYGTTLLLIEHDMGEVMDISDRVVVLDYGRKIADGTPAEVRANQAVIDAYLGVAH